MTLRLSILQAESISGLKKPDRYLWRSFGLCTLISLTLLLSACGFQLREEMNLAPEMKQIRMVIDDEYSLLARRVRVLLEHSGVTFVGSDEATAFLEIPTNRVVTEVLTVGDNARVREFRVSHTVQFRLTDAEGLDIMPLQTIRQARELSFDEQKILAASREQEYLKQDLAETLARMLVMRLGSFERNQGKS
jgi:LPS-assembly lipoprotein